MTSRLLSRTYDKTSPDNPRMDKKLTFAECLKKSLLIWGVSWHAPDIQAFLDRRVKELKTTHPAIGRQTVYNWMTGKRPSADGYVVLSRLLNVSCRWLIEGQGDMRRSVKLTPEEGEVIDILQALSKLSPAFRDNWLAQGRAMLDLVAPKGTNNPFGR